MKNLPPSQLELMNVIWEAESYITRSWIQSKPPIDKLKATTINTMLSRLTQAKFLKREHRGKEYIYTPLISKEEYMEFAGKTILGVLYDNSVKKFVASVCNSDVSREDILELQEYLITLMRGDTHD